MRFCQSKIARPLMVYVEAQRNK